MKRFLVMVPVVAALVSSCVNQSYSVSSDAVAEMLAAPGLSVTSFLPEWLNEEGRGAWALSPADDARVRAILLMGENRHVSELQYQTDDEHAPLVQNRFYVYATNGQCLAATVLETRIAMHDLVLTQEQEGELYRILKPYLKNIFSGLK